MAKRIQKDKGLIAPQVISGSVAPTRGSDAQVQAASAERLPVPKWLPIGVPGRVLMVASLLAAQDSEDFEEMLEFIAGSDVDAVHLDVPGLMRFAKSRGLAKLPSGKKAEELAKSLGRPLILRVQLPEEDEEQLVWLKSLEAGLSAAKMIQLVPRRDEPGQEESEGFHQQHDYPANNEAMDALLSLASKAACPIAVTRPRRERLNLVGFLDYWLSPTATWKVNRAEEGLPDLPPLAFCEWSHSDTGVNVTVIQNAAPKVPILADLCDEWEHSAVVHAIQAGANGLIVALRPSSGGAHPQWDMWGFERLVAKVRALGHLRGGAEPSMAELALRDKGKESRHPRRVGHGPATEQPSRTPETVKAHGFDIRGRVERGLINGESEGDRVPSQQEQLIAQLRQRDTAGADLAKVGHFGDLFGDEESQRHKFVSRLSQLRGVRIQRDQTVEFAAGLTALLHVLRLRIQCFGCDQGPPATVRGRPGSLLCSHSKGGGQSGAYNHGSLNPFPQKLHILDVSGPKPFLYAELRPEEEGPCFP